MDDITRIALQKNPVTRGGLFLLTTGMAAWDNSYHKEAKLFRSKVFIAIHGNGEITGSQLEQLKGKVHRDISKLLDKCGIVTQTIDELRVIDGVTCAGFEMMEAEATVMAGRSKIAQLIKVTEEAHTLHNIGKVLDGQKLVRASQGDALIIQGDYEQVIKPFSGSGKRTPEKDALSPPFTFQVTRAEFVSSGEFGNVQLHSPAPDRKEKIVEVLDSLEITSKGSRNRTGAAPDAETGKQKPDNFHLIIPDTSSMRKLAAECARSRQGFTGLSS